MENPPENSPPMPVSFYQALLFWLKLGCISFGGPAGQIALMHDELVEQRRWISERRFLHALNYCMVLPGPEAQQLATYLGWLMHGTLGGVVAGVLFVLPSLVLLIFLSWVYVAFGEHGLVAGLFYGIKPAVTVLVLQAVHRVGQRTLKNWVLWLVAGGAFVAIVAFNLPFPLIVFSAAVLGYVADRYALPYFRAGGGLALIDDHIPAPAHAAFTWQRLASVLCIGALLWSIPMGLLTLIYGWQHTFTQMGWFFSKAALLTFGGAYAVLPYVYQGAVSHYAWLAPSQMIDGLALGETTQGPLIMVVTFVGFVGAYSQQVLGGDARFMAGLMAACVVTWFTFLPSFVFILAGGPIVESTHHTPKFTAPLTAITAAIVGVILNLALFFAYHTCWPHGLAGNIDWSAILIAGLAAFALFRLRYNVIYVILGSACLGLVLKMLG